MSVHPTTEPERPLDADAVRRCDQLEPSTPAIITDENALTPAELPANCSSHDCPGPPHNVA